MRRDLRHTASALAASAEHADLAPPVRDHLTRWSELDVQRGEAEDAVADANAVVAVVDALLDRTVNALSSTLLAESKGKRTSKLFRAFFPESPTEIVRLGLEREIERTKAFFLVAEEQGASLPVKAVLIEMRAVHARGNEALAQRETAAVAAARVSLRRDTWRDEANRIRRSVENALDTYATEHALGRDFADAFFPAPVRAPVRKPAS